jgi:hypothetical protein
VVASPGGVGGARLVNGVFRAEQGAHGAVVHDCVVDTKEGHRTVTGSRKPGSVTLQ